MKSVAFLGGVVGVVLCLSGQGWAFKLNDSNWSYMAQPMGEPLVICPERMPGEAPQRTQDGSLAWHDDRFRFTFASHACLSNGLFPTLNNVSQIDFGPLAAGVLANTVSFFFTDAPNQTIECDIRFNSTVRWYTGIERPSPTQFDWWSVATHELGHCLGLAHEDTVSPPPVMRTTLLAGAVVRQLTTDDIAGRDALYHQPRSTTPVETPAPPAPTPVPPSPPPTSNGGGRGGGGGCTLGPSSPDDAVTLSVALGHMLPPLVLVLLIRVWSWRRAVDATRGTV